MGAFKVMLTDDQIRAAYERRRRPSWPGFEQAMAQRGFALQVMTDAAAARLEAANRGASNLAQGDACSGLLDPCARPADGPQTPGIG